MVSTAETRVRPEKILLAPVTVSPTKPLTPTHVKYLLSLDMIQRATSAFATVEMAYHHAVYSGSSQVAGFWEYLDRCHPTLRADELSEEDIGRLYVARHQEEPVGFEALRPVVRRAESGWTHPVTDRLLSLWEEHYRTLGMLDPGLGRGRPDLLPVDDLIELLVSRDLCVDGRPLKAPVYLDGTAAGLALRPVLSAQGQPNYLLYLLRELVPIVFRYDLVVLAHDVELRADYRTVAHILERLGARVTRFEVPRVPLDGITRSARSGGWEGYTIGALREPLLSRYGPQAFRLGLRLYLVAGLGRTARQSFSAEQLHRWVRRAERLLQAPAGDTAQATAYLERLTGHRGYADPYRVATALLSRGDDVPVRGLLDIINGENEEQ
ncbi:hypothetical protein ABZ595_10590 [Streptomyces rubradiris]|uniref:hypothetical protein n=1 Tax=Streptomyces rubradiris TaxID=285531 RepID=UPI0033CD9E7E